MSYFLLTSGEDGTHVEQLDEVKMLKTLEDLTRDEGKPVFLNKLPSSDKGCWMGVSEAAMLIIKGEIVVPKPVQQVTKYKL